MKTSLYIQPLGHRESSYMATLKYIARNGIIGIIQFEFEAYTSSFPFEEHKEIKVMYKLKGLKYKDSRAVMKYCSPLLQKYFKGIYNE